jgi:hypothetical protein
LYVFDAVMFSEPMKFPQGLALGRTGLPKLRGQLMESALDPGPRGVMQPRKELSDWCFEYRLECECDLKRRNPMVFFIPRQLCPIAVAQKKRNVTLRESGVFPVRFEIVGKTVGSHGRDKEDISTFATVRICEETYPAQMGGFAQSGKKWMRTGAARRN